MTNRKQLFLRQVVIQIAKLKIAVTSDLILCIFYLKLQIKTDIKLGRYTDDRIARSPHTSGNLVTTTDAPARQARKVSDIFLGQAYLPIFPTYVFKLFSASAVVRSTLDLQWLEH